MVMQEKVNREKVNREKVKQVISIIVNSRNGWVCGDDYYKFCEVVGVPTTVTTNTLHAKLSNLVEQYHDVFNLYGITSKGIIVYYNNKMLIFPVLLLMISSVMKQKIKQIISTLVNNENNWVFFDDHIKLCKILKLPETNDGSATHIALSKIIYRYPGIFNLYGITAKNASVYYNDSAIIFSIG